MCLLQPPSAPFVRMALLVLLMTIMDYPHAQIIKLFLYQKPLEAKVKIKIEYTVAQSSKNPYRHQVFGRNPDRNAKALDVHDILTRMMIRGGVVQRVAFHLLHGTPLCNPANTVAQ
jgi:hypothetical protein